MGDDATPGVRSVDVDLSTSGTPTPGPPRRSFGLRARVLAVLVLPLSLLLFLTIDDAVQSDADAEVERRNGEAIARLDRLVRLQTGVADERLETVFASRVADDTTATASLILDQAGEESLASARASTDASLLAAGEDARFDAEDLDDTRALFDSGAPARIVRARYDAHLADVSDSIDRASFVLISESAGSGAAESPLALIQLASSLAAHLSTGHQLESLVALLYAEDSEVALLRSDLARATELAASTIEQSSSYGPPSAFSDSDVGTRFDRLVETALISDAPLVRSLAISTDELTAAIQDGRDRRSDLLEETVRAASTARAIAQESEERSEDSALRSLLTALGALVVSLAAGLYLARSVVRSLRAREHLERRLFRQATIDDLTGAVHRTPALEQIDAALADGRDVAVLFIDLDRFKEVNDRHGHPVGDQVLGIVVRRLKNVTRSIDTVARIGGDEFLIVVPDAKEIDEAIELGWRILDALTRHYVVNGAELEIGASIGVASSAHSNDAGELLRSADLAVYAAKSTGRRVVAYTEKFNDAVDAVNKTEQALRHGIGRGSQLAVEYQPVVAASDGRVTALEALVRWDRPGHGRVSPDDFVPVAERTRLIIDLDVWVLYKALSDLAKIREATGLHDLTLAVNASGMTVADRDIIMRVRLALEAAQVDASALVLEVTETALVTDLSGLAFHLRELRELGVRVSIDDFGTGYTSIAQLRTLPADILKIDRSLLTDASSDGDGLLSLVVEVARRFGLRTVAEGVETAAHESIVRNLGVDGLQGYGIAPPLPLPELLELLAGRDHFRAPVTR